MTSREYIAVSHGIVLFKAQAKHVCQAYLNGRDDPDARMFCRKVHKYDTAEVLSPADAADHQKREKKLQKRLAKAV